MATLQDLVKHIKGGAQGFKNPEKALSGQKDPLSKALNSIPGLKNVRGFNAGIAGRSGKSYDPAISFGGEMSLVGGASSLSGAGITKTIGQLQEESQKARGVGFLADYDDAINSKDWEGASSIINQVMDAPDGTKMAEYAGSMVKHYTDYVTPILEKVSPSNELNNLETGIPLLSSQLKDEGAGITSALTRLMGKGGIKGLMGR